MQETSGKTQGHAQIYNRLKNRRSLDRKYFRSSVYSRIKKRIRKVYQYGRDIIKGISNMHLGFTQESKEQPETPDRYELQVHSDFGDFDLSSIHPSTHSEATNKSLNIHNLLENRRGQAEALKSIQESNEEEAMFNSGQKNIKIKQLDDSQMSDIRRERQDRVSSQQRNECTQTSIDTFKETISQIASNREVPQKAVLFVSRDVQPKEVLSRSKQEIKRKIKEMAQ